MSQMLPTSDDAPGEATFGVATVCRVWEIPRATFYDWRTRHAAEQGGTRTLAKRGPKTAISDDELVDLISELLESLEREHGITGEGYRKVHARLRFQGIRVCKNRVLRLMRESGQLAPTRTGRHRGPRVHDGRITTDRPNEMWGTDATRVVTRLEGTAWVFGAIDHCCGDIVGLHASKIGNRFEALEPIRQGVREHFGEYAEGVADGLRIRHDHGTQYMSFFFQDELEFLGAESSPSFVASPEGNGVAERFFRTLKEQLLWVRTFDTIEELRLALKEFKRTYNANWILARHGYLTPNEAREDLTPAA